MGAWVRRWRRSLVTATALAGVLGVLGVLVVLVVGPRLHPGDRAPAPATAPRPDCVGAATLTLDRAGGDAAAEAAWVRFCPLADEGATQRVRHPQGVVTGVLASSVAATLWQTQVDRPMCLPGDVPTTRPTGLFRIEVGLPSGQVAVLDGDTGCSERDRALFTQLETTLLMQAANGAGRAQPTPRPLRCPDGLAVLATSRDGATADQLVERAELTWQSTVPVLPAPASTADVCAYTGRGAARTLVDQWQVGTARAEKIRAASRDVHVGAVADCETDPARTSYVVVLTDPSGTARALAIDTTECATVRAAIGMPPVDTYLGLATQRLVRAVARSRP